MAAARKLQNNLMNTTTCTLSAVWAGEEAMSSSKPLAWSADLKDWEIPFTPGLETEIFRRSLAQSPIVDDFTKFSPRWKLAH